MILKSKNLNNGDLVEIFESHVSGQPNQNTYGVQIFKGGNRNKKPEIVESFRSSQAAHMYVSRLIANVN